VTTGVPLGDKEIRRYLNEVAEVLSPAGPRHTILVVGGALLAWHGLRDTTADVDSLLRLEEELQAAVGIVAARHGLAPAWVNDSAAGFFPQTLKESDCDVILDSPRLLVLGSPLRHVFLMKLFAARDRDQDDLVAMWPRLGLTAETVVAQYWEAYPSAPEDEYLIDWVRGIAARAD
jgi:hypothetical protein